MAARLANLIEQRFNPQDSAIQPGLNFLRFQSAQNHPESLNEGNETIVGRCDRHTRSAIQLLIKGLDLGETEAELLVLAGMAQQHEGYADIFRSFHPNHQPYPTAALAAQLFCANDEQRSSLAEKLNRSPLVEYGLLSLVGEGPIFTCSLVLNATYWSGLQSGAPSKKELSVLTPNITSAGLEKWFQSDLLRHVKSCIRQNLDCSLLLFCHDEYSALNRAVALATDCGKKFLAVQLDKNSTIKQLNQLYLSCLTSAATPIVFIPRSDKSLACSLDVFQSFPGPIFICSCVGQLPTINERVSINIPIEKLSAASLSSMWQQLLPELAAQSQELAARFPLEPYRALSVAQGIKTISKNKQNELNVQAVAEYFKNSTGGDLPECVELLRPGVGWEQLVLPQAQHVQLREAVNRLNLQQKVLDEWRFLGNRRGARGVRLLFSGPPGTGKTLSAEVLAKQLNVDLLSVDISRVVSKWIGETEKNLATVFNQAEQMKAVLFFDEADAIFGKRTEVSDSHDRYANLETAYLLSRLEAYDGMAILATNYRNNIDVAFIRRLEYIVDFKEPSVGDREKLWRCHVPENAPLSTDVSFGELAKLFPMVGGEIRNAAVSAAYFAAEQDANINQDHFIQAIRREYEKTGKAFREVKTF